MNNLQSLPNIGKEMVRKLNEIGIHTPEELRAAGTEHVFLRLKALDPGACYCMLCGIEGAIQGLRWHNLPSNRKEELKHFLKMTDKK